MKAYVSRNTDRAPARGAGVGSGMVFEFITKFGIPAAVIADDIGVAEEQISVGSVEEARPGMVVTPMFYGEGDLFTVLADGTVTALMLKVSQVEHEYPTPEHRKQASGDVGGEFMDAARRSLERRESTEPDPED